LFFSLKKTVRDSGEARRGRLSPRSLPDESWTPPPLSGLKILTFSTFFSKAGIWTEISSFLPFLPHVMIDRLESNFFYKSFNRIRSHVFFSWKCCSCEIRQVLHNISTIQKMRFLIVSSVFWFSRTTGIGNNIFQTKKTSTPDLFLVMRKKWSMSICVGGGFVIAISPWREHLGILRPSQLLLDLSRSIRPERWSYEVSQIRQPNKCSSFHIDTVD
jgi:hypothetical protein